MADEAIDTLVGSAGVKRLWISGAASRFTTEGLIRLRGARPGALPAGWMARTG